VKTVRLEDFVGHAVHDADGREIGRLHEVRARREGRELVVVDYLVGPAGWLERFSLAGIGRELAGIFGFARSRGYVVPWRDMDLGEPGRPRCRRRADELSRAD
jgi:sporulation protein YlmC with PRC-barrel domain